jgi:hypothetical protein
MEKDAGKGIDPIAVGGGDTLTRILGYVGKMFTPDGGTLNGKVGDPVSDDPIDRTPSQVPDRRNDHRPDK